MARWHRWQPYAQCKRLDWQYVNVYNQPTAAINVWNYVALVLGHVLWCGGQRKTNRSHAKTSCSNGHWNNLIMIVTNGWRASSNKVITGWPGINQSAYTICNKRKPGMVVFHPNSCLWTTNIKKTKRQITEMVSDAGSMNPTRSAHSVLVHSSPWPLCNFRKCWPHDFSVDCYWSPFQAT